MNTSSSELSRVLNFGIIEHPKSYWATHFLSILRCLHYHKMLTHKAQNLHSFPNWTLGDMRGNLPGDFFTTIRASLKNWGFQYFLQSFLNKKMSVTILNNILDILQRKYSDSYPDQFTHGTFYLSGIDSTLSMNLQNKFTDIWPSKLKDKEPNIQKLISHSDLCLILSRKSDPKRIAIFGEVEGNHGGSLRKDSYWKGKNDFCVFSIGVEKGINKTCTIETTHCNGVDRANVTFAHDHLVVLDFDFIIQQFAALFSNGPQTRIQTRVDEVDFFINFIKKYWNTPYQTLETELCKYVSESDLVGMMNTDVPIITDIQS